MKVSRENGRMVIEIDGPADTRALKDIARQMRRHPELVRAVVEKVKAERPAPGELPKKKAAAGP